MFFIFYCFTPTQDMESVGVPILCLMFSHCTQTQTPGWHQAYGQAWASNWHVALDTRLYSGLPVWSYTSWPLTPLISSWALWLLSSLTLRPLLATVARCQIIVSSCRLATFLMCSRNHSLENVLLCDWPASFSWFLFLVFGWLRVCSLLFIDWVVETRYSGFEDTGDL